MLQSPKATAKEQREAWFIACARVLLDEKGYEGMSMDELAAKTEFTKRTLYQYFADKREIFLSVVHQDIEALFEALDASIDERLDGKSNFLRMISTFLAHGREHPIAFARIVDFESHDFFYRRSTEGLSPFGARCVRAHAKITALTVDLLDRGKRDGSIRSPHKSTEIMLAVWAALLGAIQVIALRRGHLETEYETSERRMISIFERTIERILTDDAPLDLDASELASDS